MSTSADGFMPAAESIGFFFDEMHNWQPFPAEQTSLPEEKAEIVGHCGPAEGLMAIIRTLRYLTHQQLTDTEAVVMNRGLGGELGCVVLKLFENQHKVDALQVGPTMVPFHLWVEDELESVLSYVEMACMPGNTELLKLLSQSLLVHYRKSPMRGYVITDPSTQRGVIAHELCPYQTPVTAPVFCLVFGDLFDLPYCGIGMLPVNIKAFDDSVAASLKLLEEMGESFIISPVFGFIPYTIICQIALADAFKACVKDEMAVVGVGLGVLAAAYYDGCISHKQCLQLACCLRDHVSGWRDCYQTGYSVLLVELPRDQVYTLGPKVSVLSVYTDKFSLVSIHTPKRVESDTDCVLGLENTRREEKPEEKEEVEKSTCTIEHVRKREKEEEEKSGRIEDFSFLRKSSAIPEDSPDSAYDFKEHESRHSALVKSVLESIELKGGRWEVVPPTPFYNPEMMTDPTLVTKLREIIGKPSLWSDNALYMMGTTSPNSRDMLCTAEFIVENLSSPINHPAIFRHMLHHPSCVVLAHMPCCSDLTLEDVPEDRLLKVDSTALDLLTTLGKLHKMGGTIDSAKLNPMTDIGIADCYIPPCSHLVHWDHSKEYPLPKWTEFFYREKDEIPSIYRFEVKSSGDAVATSLLGDILYHAWFAIASMLEGKTDVEQTPVRLFSLVLHCKLLPTLAQRPWYLHPQMGRKVFHVYSADKLIVSGSFDLAFEEDIGQPQQLRVAKPFTRWEPNMGWFSLLRNMFTAVEHCMGGLIVEQHSVPFPHEATILPRHHEAAVQKHNGLRFEMEKYTGVCRVGGLTMKFLPSCDENVRRRSAHSSNKGALKTSYVSRHRTLKRKFPDLGADSVNIESDLNEGDAEDESQQQAKHFRNDCMASAWEEPEKKENVSDWVEPKEKEEQYNIEGLESLSEFDQLVKEMESKDRTWSEVVEIGTPEAVDLDTEGCTPEVLVVSSEEENDKKQKTENDLNEKDHPSDAAALNKEVMGETKNSSRLSEEEQKTEDDVNEKGHEDDVDEKGHPSDAAPSDEEGARETKNGRPLSKDERKTEDVDEKVHPSDAAASEEKVAREINNGSPLSKVPDTYEEINDYRSFNDEMSAFGSARPSVSVKDLYAQINPSSPKTQSQDVDYPYIIPEGARLQAGGDKIMPEHCSSSSSNAAVDDDDDADADEKEEDVSLFCQSIVYSEEEFEMAKEVDATVESDARQGFCRINRQAQENLSVRGTSKKTDAVVVKYMEAVKVCGKTVVLLYMGKDTATGQKVAGVWCPKYRDVCLRVPVPKSWRSHHTLMLLYWITARFIWEKAQGKKEGKTVYIHPPFDALAISVILACIAYENNFNDVVVLTEVWEFAWASFLPTVTCQSEFVRSSTAGQDCVHIRWCEGDLKRTLSSMPVSATLVQCGFPTNNVEPVQLQRTAGNITIHTLDPKTAVEEMLSALAQKRLWLEDGGREKMKAFEERLGKFLPKADFVDLILAMDNPTCLGQNGFERLESHRLEGRVTLTALLTAMQAPRDHASSFLPDLCQLDLQLILAMQELVCPRTETRETVAAPAELNPVESLPPFKVVGDHGSRYGHCKVEDFVKTRQHRPTYREDNFATSDETTGPRWSDVNVYTCEDSQNSTVVVVDVTGFSEDDVSDSSQLKQPWDLDQEWCKDGERLDTDFDGAATGSCSESPFAKEPPRRGLPTAFSHSGRLSSSADYTDRHPSDSAACSSPWTLPRSKRPEPSRKPGLTVASGQALQSDADAFFQNCSEFRHFEPSASTPCDKASAHTESSRLDFAGRRFVQPTKIESFSQEVFSGFHKVDSDETQNELNQQSLKFEEDTEPIEDLRRPKNSTDKDRKCAGEGQSSARVRPLKADSDLTGQTYKITDSHKILKLATLSGVCLEQYGMNSMETCQKGKWFSSTCTAEKCSRQSLPIAQQDTSKKQENSMLYKTAQEETVNASDNQGTRNSFLAAEKPMDIQNDERRHQRHSSTKSSRTVNALGSNLTITQCGYTEKGVWKHNLKRKVRKVKGGKTPDSSIYTESKQNKQSLKRREKEEQSRRRPLHTSLLEIECMRADYVPSSEEDPGSVKDETCLLNKSETTSHSDSWHSCDGIDLANSNIEHTKDNSNGSQDEFVMLETDYSAVSENLEVDRHGSDKDISAITEQVNRILRSARQQMKAELVVALAQAGSPTGQPPAGAVCTTTDRTFTSFSEGDGESQSLQEESTSKLPLVADKKGAVFQTVDEVDGMPDKHQVRCYVEHIVRMAQLQFLSLTYTGWKMHSDDDLDEIEVFKKTPTKNKTCEDKTSDEESEGEESSTPRAQASGPPANATVRQLEFWKTETPPDRSPIKSAPNTPSSIPPYAKEEPCEAPTEKAELEAGTSIQALDPKKNSLEFIAGEDEPPSLFKVKDQHAESSNPESLEELEHIFESFGNIDLSQLPPPEQTRLGHMLKTIQPGEGLPWYPYDVPLLRQKIGEYQKLQEQTSPDEHFGSESREELRRQLLAICQIVREARSVGGARPDKLVIDVTPEAEDNAREPVPEHSLTDFNKAFLEKSQDQPALAESFSDFEKIDLQEQSIPAGSVSPDGREAATTDDYKDDKLDRIEDFEFDKIEVPRKEPKLEQSVFDTSSFDLNLTPGHDPNVSVSSRGDNFDVKLSESDWDTPGKRDVDRPRLLSQRMLCMDNDAPFDLNMFYKTSELKEVPQVLLDLDTELMMVPGGEVFQKTPTIGRSSAGSIFEVVPGAPVPTAKTRKMKHAEDANTVRNKEASVCEDEVQMMHLQGETPLTPSQMRTPAVIREDEENLVVPGTPVPAVRERKASREVAAKPVLLRAMTAPCTDSISPSKSASALYLTRQPTIELATLHTIGSPLFDKRSFSALTPLNRSNKGVDQPGNVATKHGVHLIKGKHASYFAPVTTSTPTGAEADSGPSAKVNDRCASGTQVLKPSRRKSSTRSVSPALSELISDSSSQSGSDHSHSLSSFSAPSDSYEEISLETSPDHGKVQRKHSFQNVSSDQDRPSADAKSSGKSRRPSEDLELKKRSGFFKKPSMPPFIFNAAEHLNKLLKSKLVPSKEMLDRSDSHAATMSDKGDQHKVNPHVTASPRYSHNEPAAVSVESEPSTDIKAWKTIDRRRKVDVMVAKFEEKVTEKAPGKSSAIVEPLERRHTRSVDIGSKKTHASWAARMIRSEDIAATHITEGEAMLLSPVQAPQKTCQEKQMGRKEPARSAQASHSKPMSSTPVNIAECVPDENDSVGNTPTFDTQRSQARSSAESSVWGSDPDSRSDAAEPPQRHTSTPAPWKGELVTEPDTCRKALWSSGASVVPPWKRSQVFSDRSSVHPLTSEPTRRQTAVESDGSLKTAVLPSKPTSVPALKKNEKYDATAELKKSEKFDVEGRKSSAHSCTPVPWKGIQKSVDVSEKSSTSSYYSYVLAPWKRAQNSGSSTAFTSPSDEFVCKASKTASYAERSTAARPCARIAPLNLSQNISDGSKPKPADLATEEIPTSLMQANSQMMTDENPSQNISDGSKPKPAELATEEIPASLMQANSLMMTETLPSGKMSQSVNVIVEGGSEETANRKERTEVLSENLSQQPSPDGCQTVASVVEGGSEETATSLRKKTTEVLTENPPQKVSPDGRQKVAPIHLHPDSCEKPAGHSQRLSSTGRRVSVINLQKRKLSIYTPGVQGFLASTVEESVLEPLAPLKGKSAIARPLYIVHPITGSVELLKGLAAGLNVRCVGIRRTEQTTVFSVESMARFYCQALTNQDQFGTYRLAGYSYGGMVVFEMARQLQREGYKVETLIMLDGSPDYVRSQIKHTETFLPPDASPEFRTAVMESHFLLYLMNLYGPIANRDAVLTMLQELETQEERVEAAVGVTMGTVKVSSSRAKGNWLGLAAKLESSKQPLQRKLSVFSAADDVISLKRQQKAANMLRLLYIADKYDPTEEEKVQGDIHLIRIKSIPEYACLLPTDYGLGSLCTGIVHTTYVDAGHETMMQKPCLQTVVAFVQAVLDASRN